MALKSKSVLAKGEKGKAKAPTVPKPAKAPKAVHTEEEWSSEDEDEENGGVSEKGMQRLMELVDEEDLDAFERAQLADEEDEEGEKEEEGESEEDDQEGLEELDSGEVDEDASMDDDEDSDDDEGEEEDQDDQANVRHDPSIDGNAQEAAGRHDSRRGGRPRCCCGRRP